MQPRADPGPALQGPTQRQQSWFEVLLCSPARTTKAPREDEAERQRDFRFYEGPVRPFQIRRRPPAVAERGSG